MNHAAANSGALGTWSYSPESSLPTAPATSGQRMVWALDHYRGGGGALNVPVIGRIRGRLDIPRLQRSVDALVARHEALRTTFRRRQGRLEQVLHPPGQVPVGIFDLSEAADPEGAANRAIENEIRTCIDPLGSALRVTAWILHREESMLCLNVHHLVTDASSSSILLRDLAWLYRGDAVLPEIKWQYAQFAQWKASELSESERNRHLQYWTRQLDGAVSPKLPPAPARSRAGAVPTATATMELGSETMGRLSVLARKERTTLFTVILAIFYSALANTTGQNDLTVTSLFSERSRPEIINTVGYFISPLALRVQIGDEATFTDLLRTTRAVVFGAIEHQSLSYYLMPPSWMRSSSVRPDDVVLQLLPDPAVSTEIEVQHRLETDGAARAFELEVVVRPWDGAWTATVFYAADRFTAAWVARLLAAFEESANAIAQQPDMQVISSV